MSKTCSRKLNNKRGFTLAELLIVVAITGILAALSMVAIVHYAKVLKLMEMDNTAKEIFVAAQNHLTEAEASGRAASYMKKNPGEDGVGGLGELIADKYEPDDYDGYGQLPDADKPDFENEYYYLIYTPDDAGGSNADLDTSFLKRLLPYGAIDDDVRTGGSYVIEYSPVNADVYGVFYTDSFDLSLSDIVTLTNGNGRKYDEDGKAARRGYDKGVIGYYGGARADKLTVSEIEALKLEIKNDDILSVKITDNNYFDKVGGKQLQTSVKLTVVGRISSQVKEIELPLTGTSAEPTADTENNKSIKFWNITKSTDKNGDPILVYEINLDDITQVGGHFCDQFKDFIPGEDISIVASCRSEKILTETYESDPVVVNSLFDSVVDNNGMIIPVGGNVTSATANISCSRHLENLDDKISWITKADKASPANMKPIVIEHAALVNDIDWDDFKDRTNSRQVTSRVNPNSSSGNQMYNLNLPSGTYYSVKRDELQSFNGHGYTIAGIVIDNNATTAGSASDNNAGLFRVVSPESNSFAFRDVLLKDFDVKGHYNAGMLFGETGKGTIATVTIDNVIVDGGSVESDSNNASAAGLFGYCRAKNLKVNNCGATVMAYNNGTASSVSNQAAKASGFIGKLNGSAEITNCYSGGHTDNREYLTDKYNAEAPHGYAAGFLAGAGSDCKVTIRNCFNTCSASGRYAGGFIGYREGSLKSSITDCYTTGLVSATTDNCGGVFVGSGVGLNTVNTAISNSYYLEGINDQAMKTYGNPALEDKAAVTSYNDLKNVFSPKTTEAHSSSEHKGLDPKLDGKTYPFATFTKRVLPADSNNVTPEPQPVYYGDWPKEPVMGTCIFAYRETMENGGMRWSTLGAEMEDGELVIDNKPVGNLVTAKGSYVKSYSYGLLSETTLENSDFTGKFPDQFNKTPERVTISGVAYYYYTLEDNYYNNRNTKAIKLTSWKVGNGSQTVTFEFDPDYANCMTATGSLPDKYEIRTAYQLENITENLGHSYKQTCDISLGLTEKTYDAPVINGTFTGIYDGTAPKNKRYSIVNLTQETSGNRTLGLFRQINKTNETNGTVKNLSIEKASVTDNYTTIGDKNIGLLAGICNGEISSCSVGGKITVNRRSYSVTNTGLLAGKIGTYNNGEPAVIDNCSADGTIEINLLITGVTWQDVNVGGLIGMADGGQISESWSSTVINDSAYEGVTSHVLGGLLGSSSQSSVSNSYAITDYQGSKKGNLLIGESFGDSVSYCHAALQNSNRALNMSDRPFITITTSEETLATQISGSYGLTSNDSLDALSGFTKIASVNDYKTLTTFANFSTAIWAVVNEAYPTLKENPEP